MDLMTISDFLTTNLTNNLKLNGQFEFLNENLIFFKKNLNLNNGKFEF